MSDKEMDEVVDRLREEYNPPPSVPREEMWKVIQAGLKQPSTPVIPIHGGRRPRRVVPWQAMGWAAAAAAVLGMGIGIGRMTAPTPGQAPAVATRAANDGSALRLAAVEHLGRTETMLRMVRADGQSGRVDPAAGAWARTLLAQTRLFLDRSEGQDPSMVELLEDLELVLMQIEAVSQAQGADETRAQSELSLALEGLENSDVLPRIQAVMPAGVPMAGT